MLSIAERWNTIVERAARAARDAGRSPDDVDVVAVSKTHPAESVVEAFRAGARHFGENRVQELVEKRARVHDLLGSQQASQIQWHMIGQTQSRKVRELPEDLALLHTLDRVRLVQAFEKRGARPSKDPWDVLVQVDLSEEEKRGGVAYDEALGFVHSVIQRDTIRVRGLMVLPPRRTTSAETLQDFSRVHTLFTQCHQSLACGADHFTILSMGMSGDFEDAIRAGSTLIRVGSAIFGARPYP